MERGTVSDEVLLSVIADATGTTYINEVRRFLKQDQKRVRNRPRTTVAFGFTLDASGSWKKPLRYRFTA
jgi:hypothetical protein